MSALTRYFFDTVYFPRSDWAVVRWWEARRPVYNAAVGSAGLLTTTVFLSVGARPSFSQLTAAIAAYGIMANLCYSLGPVVDLLARKRGGMRYALVGPTLLRYGFVFSVGVTLLPIPVALLGWIMNLIFG